MRQTTTDAAESAKLRKFDKMNKREELVAATAAQIGFNINNMRAENYSHQIGLIAQAMADFESHKNFFWSESTLVEWTDACETLAGEVEALDIDSIEQARKIVADVLGISSTLFSPSLNSSELATILAALRLYQEAGLGDPLKRSESIHQIATSGGDCVSLDNEGIDDLCERINCI